MTWWDERIFALDLETTSADPDEARIVSMSLLELGGGRERDGWSTLVNPGVEIPQEAIDVHGVTNERARAEGIAPAEAIAKLLTRLNRRQEGPLVAFNASYDLTVLDREVRRWWVTEMESGAYARLFERIVDPLEIDHRLHKYRAGSRKLLASCEFYGVKLDVAHDPLFDALAAARLAWRLCSRGKVVRRARGDQERTEFAELQLEWYNVREDLDALHAAQVRWARERREQLQRYLWQGNPAKGVPPQPERIVELDWPVIPFDVERRARLELPRATSDGGMLTPMESEAELTVPDWTR